MYNNQCIFSIIISSIVQCKKVKLIPTKLKFIKIELSQSEHMLVFTAVCQFLPLGTKWESVRDNMLTMNMIFNG